MQIKATIRENYQKPEMGKKDSRCFSLDRWTLYSGPCTDFLILKGFLMPQLFFYSVGIKAKVVKN